MRRLARQERLALHRAEPTGVNTLSLNVEDTSTVAKNDVADEKRGSSAHSDSATVCAEPAPRADSRKHGKRSEREPRDSKAPAKVIDAYPALQLSGDTKADFPKKISHLFLDGNNMLYVIDRIR